MVFIFSHEAYTRICYRCVLKLIVDLNKLLKRPRAWLSLRFSIVKSIQNNLRSTMGQYSLQYPGKSFSISSLFTWSISSPTATLVPPGQSNWRCRLGLSTISALTLPQSSQYHHFSLCPFHGGNGTQDSHSQFGHGVVSPSPWSKTTVVMMMKMMLTIRPRNRVTTCFTREKQSSSRPKNASESLSIVLRPHSNPYIIPPRSEELINHRKM